MIKKISLLAVLLNCVPSFAAFVNEEGEERESCERKNSPVSLSFSDRIIAQSTKLQPPKDRPHCQDCGVCKICKARSDQSFITAFSLKLKTLKPSKDRGLDVDNRKLEISQSSFQHRQGKEKKFDVDLTESEQYVKRFQKKPIKEIAPSKVIQPALTLSERDRKLLFSLKKIETSPYPNHLHQLKSVLFWVSGRELASQPLNLNPKKGNRFFGRIAPAEKLSDLDEWALSDCHRDIIPFFQDHHSKMDFIFHDIKKNIQPPEESENDESSLFSAALWGGWRGDQMAKNRFRPEPELYQIQYDNLTQYTGTLVPASMRCFLGEILPQIKSHDLFYSAKIRYDAQANRDITNKDGNQWVAESLRLGNGARVQADPLLFAHRGEIERFLKDNPDEYKTIWGKDAISNHFIQVLSDLNNNQAYETWWGNLSYFQRLTYARWSKDDILKTRPWA